MDLREENVTSEIFFHAQMFFLLQDRISKHLAIDYSVKQLSDMLGIKVSTLRRWINEIRDCTVESEFGFRKNERYLFDKDVLRLVAYILLGKLKGFTLTQRYLARLGKGFDPLIEILNQNQQLLLEPKEKTSEFEFERTVYQVKNSRRTA